MKVGSLCTGYGGLEMGLKEVFPQARMVWCADNDKAASVLLAARYPGVPNLGDIKAIDWSTVERVDLLAAGIPCQPYSSAGARKGSDDDRDLVGAFLEGVRILRPKLVILENVPGFRKGGLPRVLGGLSAMGFHARWHSVRASEAGASHRRERVFVLAHSADDGREWSRLARLWRQGPANGSEALAHTNDTEPVRQPGEQPGRPVASWSSHQTSSDSEHRSVSERPRDSRGEGRQRPAERGGLGSGREIAADAYGSGQQGSGQKTESPRAQGSVDWGEYEAAVRRQEYVFGRLAPPPTEIGPRGNIRLSPYFTEWMMGPPPGWITDFEFARKDAFRLLGNGVVPRQAALAIKGLVDEESYCSAGWRGSAGIQDRHISTVRL